MRLGFSQVDNIILGDTSHSHYERIWTQLGETETLIAVAESGVSNVFLELPQYRQSLVDEFQVRSSAGLAVDVDAFAYRFEHEDSLENNVSSWTFSHGDTQDFINDGLVPILSLIHI